MKKIMSIALCLLLLLVMGTMVFAADNVGNEVVLGENAIVVPYGTGTMGRLSTYFVAEATGNYTFTCTSGTDGDCAIRAGDPTDLSIPWLYNGESYTCFLVEGQSIDVEVWTLHIADEDNPVTFTVTTDAQIDKYKDWPHLSLGVNEINVNSLYAFDGLPCVFIPENTGIYRITTTDDNAYLNADGFEMEGAGVVYETTVQAGAGLEIMVGTYDMEPDSISFTIEAVSVAKTELTLGTNNVYIPQDRAQHGLDCTFTVETSGVYEITAISENALISANGGSWFRVGESQEFTAGAGDVIKMKIADVNEEESGVILSIELKQAVTSHQYVAEVTPPSCAYEGYTTYTCTICGDSYKDDFVEATGEHVYTETERVEATCTEDGHITKSCMCGDKQETVLPMTGHANGEAVKENEVTGDCTTDAAYDLVVRCENCGEEVSRETVTVTAPGHVAGEAVKENEVAATCAKDGSYDLVLYCQNCNAEMSRTTEVVKATGNHVYSDEKERVEATCTEDGHVIMACGCGATETTTLPKTGHDNAEAVKENEKAATCTEAGSYEMVVYCKICKAEISREKTVISATGHDNAEAVKENEKAATCTEDGSYEMVVYCKTCKAEVSREKTVVPKTGHKEAEAVRENEVFATCGTDGSYDLVVYCQTCDAELSRKHETVKSTGDHVYAQEKECQDATCTEDGYVIMACGCGATETTTLPKTGHDLAEAVKENEKAATCTEDGSYEMVVYCKTCKAEISREKTVISATGHDLAEAVKENEKANSCTEDGSYEMVVYCKTCKAEISREKTVVPATGHDNADAVKENEKANSCTEDGSYEMVVYCKTCKAEVSREKTIVPKTGHKNAEAVHENEIFATCGSDGSYDLVVYCEYCNIELSRTHETVKSTGEHVYAQETDRKDATCTEDGYVTKACGCGATETTTLPKTGHTGAEAVKENEVAPTCTVDGSYDAVVYCSVCAVEMSREATVVPATGHAPAEAVKENEIAATCTQDGSYDMVVYCTVCAEELSRETTAVPSTGEHVYATETERKNATCTEVGYVIMSCGCGETQTTELPMIDHVAGEAANENEVAATCTEAGSYDVVIRCSACAAELERNTVAVEATGHTFGEWTTTKEPTATEDGVKTRTCACGEVETEVIPALGENETKPTEPAETKPAETKPAETKPAETKPATQPTEPNAGDEKGGNVITIVIIAVVVVAAGVVAFVVIKKKK